MPIQINDQTLLNELKTLATFTHVEPSDNGTAVTRIVFSEDDLCTRAWLKDLASAEGFSIREDAVGNTFIRWPGTEPDLKACCSTGPGLALNGPPCLKGRAIATP